MDILIQKIGYSERKPSKYAKRCEHCDGELSRIPHTDFLGKMFLICLECGETTVVGTIPNMNKPPKKLEGLSVCWGTAKGEAL